MLPPPEVIRNHIKALVIALREFGILIAEIRAAGLPAPGKKSAVHPGFIRVGTNPGEEAVVIDRIPG
jgi:hypothetical protein